jgi:hypothetical protein
MAIHRVSKWEKKFNHETKGEERKVERRKKKEKGGREGEREWQEKIRQGRRLDMSYLYSGYLPNLLRYLDRCSSEVIVLPYLGRCT